MGRLGRDCAPVRADLQTVLPLGKGELEGDGTVRADFQFGSGGFAIRPHRILAFEMLKRTNKQFPRKKKKNRLI